MVDIKSLLNLQGQLFLLLLCGAVFRKYIVGDEFKKGLTDVLINLIMPCNIIQSFRIELYPALLQRTAAIFLVSFINLSLAWGLSCVLYRNISHDRQVIMKYGTLCSNSGFCGIPIAEGIWGSEGVLFSAFFLIPQRIFMWIIGVSFFTKRESTSLLWRSLATNPCIIATVIGLFLMITQVSLPPFLGNSIQALSQCCIGLSMFLIGMIVVNVKWKDFLDLNILYLSIVRLFLLPLIAFVFCRVCHIDNLAANVSVILISMPVAGTTAVLTSKYGGNAEFAAGSIATSTILSLVAVPLWSLVLLYIH